MAVTCQPDYEVSDSIIHIIVEVLGVCFWPRLCENSGLKGKIQISSLGPNHERIH
jgi:hypothetical protein